MELDLENKLIWLADDFRYLGQKIVELDDSVHMTAKIAEATIDNNEIKLLTAPQDFYYPEKLFTYSINLRRTKNDIYEGEWLRLEEPEATAKLWCEKYENNSHYFLMGAWDVEEDESYFVYHFWMAKIAKGGNKSFTKLPS
jgi:hypothetical protein